METIGDAILHLSAQFSPVSEDDLRFWPGILGWDNSPGMIAALYNGFTLIGDRRGAILWRAGLFLSLSVETKGPLSLCREITKWGRTLKEMQNAL